MTTLSDLISKVQASEFVTSVKSVATSLGLIPDDWVELDPEDAMANAFGQTAATWWNTYVYFAIRGGLLDYAEKKWLELLAKNVFNVDKIKASFATGTWTGTNATASNIGPFNAGDLLFYDLDTNKTYRNTNASPVTFIPGVNPAIPIAADEIGSGSNAAPSRVVLLTTVLGLSGSNAAAVSGFDDESDESLRARCRLKFASLSPNGAKAAYQYVALTPSLNGGIAVNRVKVSNGSINGTVRVVLAKASGPLDSGEVTTVDAKLQALVVPTGATLTTANSVAHSIAVTWQAWCPASANVDPTAARDAANAALAKAFESFPIDGFSTSGVPGTGKVFVNILEATIRDAIPEAFQVSVTIPSGDVAIATDEIPTWGVPTGTVTNV